MFYQATDSDCVCNSSFVSILSVNALVEEFSWHKGRKPHLDSIRPVHIIITVHGIRTFGEWQETLERSINRGDPSKLVLSFRFGYFSSLEFLIPPFRWIQVRNFRNSVKAICELHPGARIDLVGHSFGTHLIGWSIRHLVLKCGCKFHTVILAGSVLKPRFRWEKLFQCGGIKLLVNDCGIEDNILILSHLFAPFSGMAGRVGFYGLTGNNMINRYFRGGHGLFFKNLSENRCLFMEEYWLPLLVGNAIVERVDQRSKVSIVQGIFIFSVQNLAFVKVLLLLIGSIFLVSSIVDQQRRAEDIRLRRNASELAFQSSSLLTSDLLKSLSIAVEACSTKILPETRSALLAPLVELEYVIGIGDVATYNSQFSFEGEDTVVVVDANDMYQESLGRFTFISQQNGKWVLESPINVRADSSNVDPIVKYLDQVNAQVSNSLKHLSSNPDPIIVALNSRFLLDRCGSSVGVFDRFGQTSFTTSLRGSSLCEFGANHNVSRVIFIDGESGKGQSIWRDQSDSASWHVANINLSPLPQTGVGIVAVGESRVAVSDRLNSDLYVFDFFSGMYLYAERWPTEEVGEIETMKFVPSSDALWIGTKGGYLLHADVSKLRARWSAYFRPITDQAIVSIEFSGDGGRCAVLGDSDTLLLLDTPSPDSIDSLFNDLNAPTTQFKNMMMGNTLPPSPTVKIGVPGRRHPKIRMSRSGNRIGALDSEGRLLILDLTGGSRVVNEVRQLPNRYWREKIPPGDPSNPLSTDIFYAMSTMYSRNWANGNSVDIDNAGKLLSSCGDDGAIYVWDMDSDSLLWSQEALSTEIVEAEFTPDTQLLVVVGADNVSFWNALTGNEIGERIKIDNCRSLAISPDGHFFALNTGSAYQIWSLTEPRRLLSSVRSSSVNLIDCEFSADSKHYAIPTDRSVNFVSTERLGEVTSINVTDATRIVRFSPQGGQWIAASEKKVYIYKPTLDQLDELELLPEWGIPSDLVIVNGGREAVIGTSKGFLVMCDIEEVKWIGVVSQLDKGGIYSLTTNPIAETVFVGIDNYSIYRIDIAPESWFEIAHQKRISE